LGELVRRSGCRILLDVNNVYVSSRNLGLVAQDALADLLVAVPGASIAEIHLAGHSEDPTYGPRLLVDSHDAPVAEAVWALYQQAIDAIGARPTLIERDGNIPAFAALLLERGRAHDLLGRRHAMEAA
jgi:hypothetical protein